MIYMLIDEGTDGDKIATDSIGKFLAFKTLELALRYRELNKANYSWYNVVQVNLIEFIQPTTNEKSSIRL